jgi:hypothetical protein
LDNATLSKENRHTNPKRERGRNGYNFCPRLRFGLVWNANLAPSRMTTGKQLALAAAVLIVVTVSLTHTATFAGDVPRRPNFIFILTDDQGWSEMSAAMDPKVPKAASDYLETPNLERMAKAGMRFQSGYSPAPLCTPTRRSIQCGMTPARQRGTEFKSTFDWTGRLTIPQALKPSSRLIRPTGVPISASTGRTSR